MRVCVWAINHELLLFATVFSFIADMEDFKISMFMSAAIGFANILGNFFSLRNSKYALTLDQMHVDMLG